MPTLQKQSAAVKNNRPKIPEVPLTKLNTLWLQVGGTLCNLQCTHCFISCGPQNNTHGMMSLEQVNQRLEESKLLGVKDYYITGGEVFMNPEIFKILTAILEYGPLDVLTNGTFITPEKAGLLREIQNGTTHNLQFRVSMESFDEEINNQIRGEGAFRKATEGISNLGNVGFSPILTITRNWEEDKDLEMEKKFIHFLKFIPDPTWKS